MECKYFHPYSKSTFNKMLMPKLVKSPPVITRCDWTVASIPSNKKGFAHLYRSEERLSPVRWLLVDLATAVKRCRGNAGFTMTAPALINEFYANMPRSFSPTDRVPSGLSVLYMGRG